MVEDGEKMEGMVEGGMDGRVELEYVRKEGWVEELSGYKYGHWGTRTNNLQLVLRMDENKISYETLILELICSS